MQYEVKWIGEVLHLFSPQNITIGHIKFIDGRWKMALGRPNARKTPYFLCSGPYNGPAELMEQYRKMGYQCPPREKDC